MTKLREVPDFRELKRGTYLRLRDKPVFLDPQLLDFPVQRRAGNSQFRCRTFWARNSPLTLSARALFNHFSLLILESVWQDLPIPAGVGCTLVSQALSIQTELPPHQITDLSTMFCNSRIFPG
jgi:hypothetical protein